MVTNLLTNEDKPSRENTESQVGVDFPLHKLASPSKNMTSEPNTIVASYTLISQPHGPYIID